MYKIGLPEHRKYCSPLQALLWIAIKSSFSKEKNPIKPYALSNLLDEAWIFDPRLSPQLVDEIVATIRDPEIRKDFEKDITEKNKYLDYRLRTRIEYFPELFPEWVTQKLKELKSNSPWSDYNEVLDRLNSPELVDYYATKQINYSEYYEIAGYDGYRGDPYYVFNYKKGDCLLIHLHLLLKPFEETATEHGLKKDLQPGFLIPGMQFPYSKFRGRSTLLMMGG